MFYEYVKHSQVLFGFRVNFRPIRGRAGRWPNTVPRGARPGTLPFAGFLSANAGVSTD
jgi:hypothetical protein